MSAEIINPNGTITPLKPGTYTRDSTIDRLPVFIYSFPEGLGFVIRPAKKDDPLSMDLRATTTRYSFDDIITLENNRYCLGTC